MDLLPPSPPVDPLRDGLERALDGALQRLAESHMITGYGPWRQERGRIVGRRAQVQRGHQSTHLFILTLALSGEPHPGACRPDDGRDVIALMRPGCTVRCRDQAGSDAAYVAMRISRAIAAAAGETPERIARIIANAPPRVDPIDAGPRTLCDTLFG